MLKVAGDKSCLGHHLLLVLTAVNAWGWRDDLVVEGACTYPRGPLHLHSTYTGVSQAPAAPPPGHLTLLASTGTPTDMLYPQRERHKHTRECKENLS